MFKYFTKICFCVIMQKYFRVVIKMKELSISEIYNDKSLPLSGMKTRIFKRCTDILLSLKIQPDVLGFDYLRRAIMFCLENQDLLENITGSLYPCLAKYFGVRSTIIERCMRDAVNTAFVKGGLLGLNNLYNKVIYRNDFRPSSSELIAIIVEKIRIEIIKNKLLQLKEQTDN